MTRLAIPVLALLLLPSCGMNALAPDIEKPSREGYAILGHAETTLATHPDAAAGGVLAETLDEVRNARERFRQINRLSLRDDEVQQ